jgi:hypothetical protein
LVIDIGRRMLWRRRGKVRPEWAKDLIGKNVLFIDPGITGTGLAFFQPLVAHKPTKTYSRAGKGYGGDWQHQSHMLAGWLEECLWNSKNVRAPSVVIEFPRTFGSAKSYAATVDGSLSKLVYLIGLYSAVVWKVTWRQSILLDPCEWKGQLPKKVVDGRIESAGWGTYHNHVSDAVGMGLAAIGRL